MAAPNLRSQIKLILLKNPDLDLDSLINRLEKRMGARPSKITVSATRSELRHTIKILHQLGMLKNGIWKD